MDDKVFASVELLRIQRDRWDAVADERGISRSELIRQAVERDINGRQPREVASVGEISRDFQE